MVRSLSQGHQSMAMGLKSTHEELSIGTELTNLKQ